MAMNQHHHKIRQLSAIIALGFLAQTSYAEEAAAPPSLFEVIRNARLQAQQQATQLAPAPIAPPPAAVPTPVTPANVTATPPKQTAPTQAAPTDKPAKPTTSAEKPAATPVASKPAETAKPAEATPEAAPLVAKIAPRNTIQVEQPKFATAGGVTLRFDNAEIYEVVQTVLGDILHLNYVVDPGVTGKVNINGLSPVSAEDLFGVLESVLALNNVSIIKDGNVYKVVRDAVAPRDTVSAIASGDNGTLIQIFAPRYVQPSALVTALKAFVGAQATIVNDPTDHYLIIVDRARNMKKLQEMVEMLDIDYLNQVQTEIVQIENGDAAEVAKEMETLFKTSQMYNWRGTEANKVFFMPIKRMNAILVAAANKEVLATAKARIRDVDIVPKEGLGSRINIYTVRNSSAAYLAGLISQIYGGSAPAVSTATKVIQKGPVASTSAAGAGLSGEVQIIPNEKSNSLIIKASRQDYLQILKLLEQLDTISRQVMIQANIIEVTLTGERKLGIEWSLLHERLNGKPAKLALGGIVNKTSAGLLYTVSDSLSNVIGTIQAVATQNDINVLSSPQILASDGKESKIEIGQDVPVRTSAITNVGTSGTTTSTSGTTLTESVSYRTVGLILKVKPSINESGLVGLEISQEVSDVVNDANASGTTPRFTKRSIDTEVTLQEGKTLVIGGLIQTKGTLSETGIPYLKDIPLLGSMFKGDDKVHERTELLLTLTPYIIRNQGDADKLSHDLDQEMDEIRAYLAKQKRPLLANKIVPAQPKP